MTTTRKGFNRERHTALKIAFAAVATGGFSLAWAGFAASHEPAVPVAPLSYPASAIQAIPIFTPTPSTAGAASRTNTSTPPATSTPTPTVAVEATGTAAAPRTGTPQARRRTRAS